MKNLFLIAAFAVFSTAANAGVESVGDRYFTSKNWSVFRVGNASAFPNCALRSSIDYLDKFDRKAGGVFVEVGYPGNDVTLLGENIIMYFKISKGSTIQVGQGNAESISPQVPKKGEKFVASMLAKKTGHVKIEISYGDDNPSIHRFPIAGFAEAYGKLKECSVQKNRS